MRRHDLIYVDPPRWRQRIEASAEFGSDPLIVFWADKGWPLVRRRPAPGETTGVGLGLPLPPSAGKRRLGFVLPEQDIAASEPPLLLAAARQAAPAGWSRTLDEIEEIGRQHGVEVRLFGALAWQALTGLAYLSKASDLDLLFYIGPTTDVAALTAGLADIESRAPVRLDGELIRHDGTGVNWRELHIGADEVLVKTLDGAVLVRPDMFHRQAVLS